MRGTLPSLSLFSRSCAPPRSFSSPRPSICCILNTLRRFSSPAATNSRLPETQNHPQLLPCIPEQWLWMSWRLMMPPIKNSVLPSSSGVWTHFWRIWTCPLARSYTWQMFCMDPSNHSAGPAMSMFRPCFSRLCLYPLAICNGKLNERNEGEHGASEVDGGDGDLDESELAVEPGGECEAVVDAGGVRQEVVRVHREEEEEPERRRGEAGPGGGGPRGEVPPEAAG
ncbi:Os02g0257250 [Oryza sativa Japonica Group]|uniref:Os02g0257250 protein n=1 Tax=Oryza sativa subsp. japonica TaxID=39947 RepID=A0A0P0VH76_ORYSJ|nr:Os02g0257250 [Oryza sativa Japonica Group]